MERVSVDSERSDPLLGKLIDKKYQIDALLGRGGMGVVYKATHTLMKRTVAIKMLHRGLLVDSGESNFIERFQREAQTHASFEHPHAVTIHEYGVYEGSPFLVMQYVEGRTLKELLKDEWPLARSRILPFIIQVSEALHEAHSVGVVHRDLKPDNIMIAKTRDGREKAILLDFGIAKVLERDKTAPDVTQEGKVTGTPQYMSPEQVSGKELDERSDIYSMGVILYELCTGQRPFDADTAVALMMNHMSEAPKAFTELAPGLDIPPALEKVVMKALEKNPDKRQQSLTELVDELIAAVPEECSYDRRALEDDRKRFPVFAIATLLVLVVALAGMLVYQYRFNSSSTVQNSAADWSVIRGSLDDAVEKVSSLAEKASKAAGYSQRIANTKSPSERERWEQFRKKAIDECDEVIAAYRRELETLVGLTDAAAIKQREDSYIKESLTTQSVVPNRLAIFEKITNHLFLLEEKAELSDDKILSDSIRAADPDSLARFSGYFKDFCASCES